jgi:mRNA interferase MazF
MRRGEICLIDLDPVRGSEANKVRPAVIVSNDAANRSARRGPSGVVTIVPITSNIERVYPFQVLLPAGVAGLARPSKAQAEQVRSVSAARIGRTLGTLSGDLLHRVDAALRLHLAL